MTTKSMATVRHVYYRVIEVGPHMWTRTSVPVYFGRCFRALVGWVYHIDTTNGCINTYTPPSEIDATCRRLLDLGLHSRQYVDAYSLFTYVTCASARDLIGGCHVSTAVQLPAVC